MTKKNNYDLVFWKTRSKKYNNLEWANHRLYLNEFIKAGDFTKQDTVLDVGTGTGIIAHTISSFVKEVIGLDKSQDMLEHSNWKGNMYFIKGDIRQPIFAEETFDKITTRQVFHHILEDTQKAMDECYRVLRKDGSMIFSEGVPPNARAKEDYIEIFKLKEERLTFMPEDLEILMRNSGFKGIRTKIIWLEKMSFRNWLINSGLPQNIQEKIFMMRRNSPDHIKKAYRMVDTGEDCFIDMKIAILVGRK
jgi:ubiquinone/menaquinone biosynthesis C-methylase UbiE